MNVYVLLSIPIVTGLIGWLTNWLAVKLLFRPKKPFGISKWKVQGLIPKRRDLFSARIGEIIERELINSHLIRSKLDEVDLNPHMHKLSSRLIDELAGSLKNIPLLGSFITDDTVSKFEEKLANKMKDEAHGIIQAVASEVEPKINVKKLVEEKISCFDLDKLESIILEIAKKELKFIEWLGGILGFAVGLIQLAYISLL